MKKYLLATIVVLAIYAYFAIEGLKAALAPILHF